MVNLSEQRDGVQVIRRAMQILDVLKDAPEGLSLSQIAAQTGLARSTVHRLVGALEVEHLVATTAAGRYRLGSAIGALASAAERYLGVDFHPTMAKLARETKESVDLSVLEHDHTRILHQIAATQRLRAVSSVGMVFPAHATAGGKVLLAQLDRAHLLRLLPQQLERFADNTIVDRDVLLGELEEVRRTGIAFDREEYGLGICAVAGAFTDAGGQVVAIGIPMPAQRFYGNEESFVAAIESARREVEQAA